MEDPFEKPLSTGDEHLRWPLADVAPEMLEVSVVAVRAQSRSPEPRVVPQRRLSAAWWLSVGGAGGFTHKSRSVPNMLENNSMGPCA